MSASRHDGPPRIALVTGASRGIGRAAALALAKSGAHVVALARTQGGLEELDDEIRALRPDEPEATTLVPMDLRDFAAIDRLGEALHRRWGRLDAFVGNAGVLGLLTPLHQLDPKTWDDVMAVNVTANWRLIRSLDPLLRLSDAGRVAFITSGAASRADLRAYWGPYAVSKAALDALARTYAAETLNTSNIRVMLVNPGPLRTRMRATAMPGEDPSRCARRKTSRQRSSRSARPIGPRRANFTISHGSNSEFQSARARRKARTSRCAILRRSAASCPAGRHFRGGDRELCTPFRLEPCASPSEFRRAKSLRPREIASWSTGLGGPSSVNVVAPLQRNAFPRLQGGPARARSRQWRRPGSARGAGVVSGRRGIRTLADVMKAYGEADQAPQTGIIDRKP